MPNRTDDELLSNIHTLIQQLGSGNTETLLELLRRIIAAETLAVQLQSRVDDYENQRAADTAAWATSHEQLRVTLRAMLRVFWGLTAVVCIIVLLLVIATGIRLVRG